ncbi:hypothetical protein FHW69_001516 [Luteibacter sp. Sphag1AF]|nr:hypothetical protein [Luteibacter sp. Sphag1AF]
MVSLQQGLLTDEFEVSMVKLRRWFGVARRTVYCRPTKAPPKIQEAIAALLSKRSRLSAIGPSPACLA